MAESKSTDTRVNLAALKRVDQYAVEIVETGTQVAIYKFDSQSNEWEKTDVEGTLFLYARSGDPRHGFVVMNRLSTENLVEPITKDLEIQLQAPFLLYKNSKMSITGVWFYEESECTRIAKKLEALVKEESQRRRPNAQDKSGVDILSLLTKAHGEYEQKGKPAVPSSAAAAAGADVLRPTALRPPPQTNGGTPNGVALQSTPLSVADLFATEPSGPVTPVHQGGPSIFERLMTPTGGAPPAHTAQSLERELRGKEKGKPTNGQPEQSLPHAAPIRTTSHKPGGLATANVKTTGTPPRPVGGTQPVALMSPMMFAAAGASAASLTTEPVETVGVQTPVKQQKRNQVFPTQQPQQGDDLPLPQQGDNEVTPLTRAQLMQAFNYLLKNDPNFVTQLHDAYVQSLKQSLKTGHR